MEVADFWPRLSTSIYCGQERMEGKVVIVTGANSGIGLETAKELARRGARVILGCRNVERGLDAQDEIIEETGNYDVFFRKIDLENFESVRNFAFGIMHRERRLDVLINNAGVCNVEDSMTVDGLPVEAQVNYFGPFLLTLILIPLLKRSAPSRIINVTSRVHYIGVMIPEKFVQPSASWVDKVRTYANTKLAMVMFTIKLGELLKDTGVTVNCSHPGLVMTGLYKTRRPLKKELVDKMFKSAWEGAQASVFLAVAPQVEHVTGKFFVDCEVHRPAHQTRNRTVVDKLWLISQRHVQWFYSSSLDDSSE